MRTRLAVIVAATLLLTSGGGSAAPDAPKLAVILVVDQMRADYIDRFKEEWTGGLKRLVDRGAWFRRAAYPYLTTVTCAGHATVATGVFPRTHGVMQNAWWDRDRHAMITCTEDSNAHDIGYGTPVKGGDSAHQLAVPTFADQMRRQRSAHVVTLALKDRSAIMLAGHGADASTWLSDSLDGWVTSSAFARTPNAAVKTFTDANPIAADYGKTWTRLLPASRYHGVDDGESETAPTGWTSTFPHVLNGTSDHPDLAFYTQWERSPFADAYVGRFAATLAESLELGRHAGTDVLAVSFSTPDLVGHAFGPNSQEVEDLYVHLDRTIGTLLDRLDALVGRGDYVVALTSDHGVTPIPEQLLKAGRDAGRFNVAAMVDAVEKQAQAALGPGEYVARLNGNDLYFERGAYAKLQASSGAVDAIVRTLAATPGVARVFRSEQLKTPESAGADDVLLRAAALSYVDGRSGDLVLAPKPGWMFSGSGTTHGTANPDDQQVPIVLMGRRIKAGQYLQPATPADIAPTLAAVCGTTMPNAEGHVLRVAVK